MNNRIFGQQNNISFQLENLKSRCCLIDIKGVSVEEHFMSIFENFVILMWKFSNFQYPIENLE